MWWDILPLIGHPGKPEFAKLDQAALTVMEECLALPSVACQESALHGLGHWNMYFPSEVQSIIDSFLKSEKNLRPELLQYAKSARSGCVN